MQKSARNNLHKAVSLMTLIRRKVLLTGTIALLWHLEVVSMELAMVLLACYEPMNRVSEESN